MWDLGEEEEGCFSAFCFEDGRMSGYGSRQHGEERGLLVVQRPRHHGSRSRKAPW